MKLPNKRPSRYRSTINNDGIPKAPQEGLVLLDMALRPVACDRGAAAILKTKNDGHEDRECTILVPKEVVDWVSKRSRDELSAAKFPFRLGSGDYICRTYLMQPDTSSPVMLALHIERASSVTDPVKAVSAKYSLTEREEEALRGISMGLSSKELAVKMNISPNTVKVFLRLIMIKMGVTTRGGIVAQILQTQSEHEVEERSFTTTA